MLKDTDCDEITVHFQGASVTKIRKPVEVLDELATILRIKDDLRSLGLWSIVELEAKLKTVSVEVQRIMHARKASYGQEKAIIHRGALLDFDITRNCPVLRQVISSEDLPAS